MMAFESDAKDGRVRFGPMDPREGERADFELDLRTLELSRDGEPLALRPQPSRLLAILVQGEGKLVTIDVLRRALWGNRHLAWRNGLHQCVRDLRRVLADEASRPRLVETVPRRGYRFIGRMTSPDGLQPAAPAPPRPRPGVPFWKRPGVAFAAGVGAAVLVPLTCLLLLCLALA